MQIGFFFDQTRCTGCLTCVVACKDWNDIPAGPVAWKTITTVEKGKFPDIFVAFNFRNCYHCANPACIDACPVGAIRKREQDGIVLVDEEICLGGDSCGKLCLETCPYAVPQFDSWQNSKMQKCNLCIDRLMVNKKPTCVDACPMLALDAAPMDELKVKYGQIQEAIEFEYSPELEPSVIFKPKERV